MLHVSSGQIGAVCYPDTSSRRVARLGLEVKVAEIAGGPISSWAGCNSFYLASCSHGGAKPTSLNSVEIRNQLKSIVLFN
jgi:hypothetical protein